MDINKLVIDGQALANLRFRPIIKFMRQLRLGGSRAPLHRLRQVLYKMSSVFLGSDLSIGMCMLLIRLITVNGRWKWKVRLIYERCIARKHIRYFRNTLSFYLERFWNGPDEFVIKLVRDFV